jgi:hypothetical protein
MIDRGAKVPVKRQAELLDLSRSSVYYTPRPLSERDLMLMRRIDELHLELPFCGSRKLADRLRREGHEVGRRHVATLMRRLGIEALYRRPRTSIPARGAAIYEKGVGRELEGSRSMGLHAEQSQVALDSAFAHARGLCQRSHRPMRGRFGLARQGSVEQLRDLLFIVSTRPTGLQLIVQPGQTQLAKSQAPVMHRRAADLQTPTHFVERHARFAPQNQLRTAYQSVRHAA